MAFRSGGSVAAGPREMVLRPGSSGGFDGTGDSDGSGGYSGFRSGGSVAAPCGGSTGNVADVRLEIGGLSGNSTTTSATTKFDKLKKPVIGVPL